MNPDAEETANLTAMKTAKDASFTQDKFDDVLSRAVRVHDQVMNIVHKKYKELPPVHNPNQAADLGGLPFQPL